MTELLCDEDGLGANGSGFLIDSLHVVTVGHVVEGSTWTVVRGIDGQLARADVVGRDDDHEVALLKLRRPLKGTRTLKFETAAAKRLDPVAAIGYPEGGALTTTTGEVSAVDVRAQVSAQVTLKGLVQFTAPVSEGSSGGPVINATGKVVGLVEGANVSGNSLYQAIPATEASKYVARWLRTPEPREPEDCAHPRSQLTVDSLLPDAPVLATTLSEYFDGLYWKNAEVPGTGESGYDLASEALTEDLAKKYPDANALAQTYDDVTISDAHLVKSDTNGQLEDWAEVSWSHTKASGFCERHAARFTLRLDSGWWLMASRKNLPNPAGGCSA